MAEPWPTAGSPTGGYDELTEALSIAKVGFWRWRLSDDTFTWSDEIFRILGRDEELVVVPVVAVARAESGDLAVACLSPAQAFVELLQLTGAGVDGTRANDNLTARGNRRTSACLTLDDNRSQR